MRETAVTKIGKHILAPKVVGPYTSRSVSEATGLPKGTVSVYLSKMVAAGFLEKIEEGGYRIFNLGAIRKAVDTGTIGRMCNVPNSNGKDNGNDTLSLGGGLVERDPVSEFQDYISHLSWLLDEFIPDLEAERDKYKTEAASLYDQLNSFVGVMKRAKVIHNGIDPN